VDIHNNHDAHTGPLTVSISGPDASSFNLRGGDGGSAASRNIPSIAAYDYLLDAFSIEPRTGLPGREQAYIAIITVTGQGIWESFEVRFRVTYDHYGDGVFTLTLRARSGGRVSLGDSSYRLYWTGQFRYGERINISAMPDREFNFYRWTYNHGETTNEHRENTTFIMPNRSVTVWAEFLHYRYWDWRWDWRRDRDREWEWAQPPYTPPYAALPVAPQRPGPPPTTPPGQPLPPPPPPMPYHLRIRYLLR
jgi:hypothetical protein